LLSFNANADKFSFKYKTRIQEIACRQEARVMPNCVLKDWWSFIWRRFLYHNRDRFFFVKGAKERVRVSVDAWPRDHIVREDRTRLLAYWQATRRVPWNVVPWD